MIAKLFVNKGYASLEKHFWHCLKSGRDKDKARELVAGKVEIQLHDQAKVGFSKICQDWFRVLLVAAVHDDELSTVHKYRMGRHRRDGSRQDSVHRYTVVLRATHWCIVRQDNSSVKRSWFPHTMDRPHGMETPAERSGMKQEARGDTWVAVSGGGDNNHRRSF